MPQATHHNTPHLRTVYAGRDLLQLVSTHDAVLLDTTASHYDVLGCLALEHAAVELPLDAAKELADALQAAIEDAEAFEHPDQPGFGPRKPSGV